MFESQLHSQGRAAEGFSPASKLDSRVPQPAESKIANNASPSATFAPTRSGTPSWSRSAAAAKENALEVLIVRGGAFKELDAGWRNTSTLVDAKCVKRKSGFPSTSKSAMARESRPENPLFTI